MSPKFPIISPREITKALEASGFELISQKGSHAKYVLNEKDKPKKTTFVPLHDNIPIGTLRAILKQAGITIEELKKKL